MAIKTTTLIDDPELPVEFDPDACLAEMEALRAENRDLEARRRALNAWTVVLLSCSACILLMSLAIAIAISDRTQPSPAIASSLKQPLFF